MEMTPHGLVWRIFSWCAVVWCTFLPVQATAQTSTPANRQGIHGYYHDDEHDAVSAPRQAIDRALTDLMGKIAGVKPKSGPLDTEGLKKALADGLQGLKPPDRLKITSWAACNVVDPKDVGGYWSGPGANFAEGDEKVKTWQTKLNIDEKKFALSGPPLAQLKYVIVSPRFASQAARPYGKEMRVLIDYGIVVTVSVTFDRQSVANGTDGTFAGVGEGSPSLASLTGTVALTDRTTSVVRSSR